MGMGFAVVVVVAVLVAQVGKSLGGALAVLNSVVLAQCDDVNKITVFTAGCPKMLTKTTAVDILEPLRLETVHQSGSDPGGPRDSRLSVVHVAHAQVCGSHWDDGDGALVYCVASPNRLNKS